MFPSTSDEDTRPVLENIVWYLMVRYGCSKPLAVNLVYSYYAHPTFVDDDFIHHYGAVRIAAHIYRVIFLDEDTRGRNLVE